MTVKIQDNDGNTHEVPTQDEVQQIKEEAVEEGKSQALEDLKEQNPEISDEIEDLQDEIGSIKNQIEDVEGGEEGEGEGEEGGNPNQIQRLKKQIGDEIEEKFNNLKNDMNELRDNVVGESKEELLDQIAGEDEDLRERVEHEFNNYRPNDTSDKAIKERMKKAAQLVGEEINTDPSAIDNALSGQSKRGRGKNREVKSGDEIDEEVKKDVGSKLGLSEEDFEEYGDNN